MDYYQGVVEEYLRADRSVFVNPEFCLQLAEDKPMPEKGTSWYVDLLAVDFRLNTAFLCEVTYSHTMTALVRRLAAWSNHWTDIAVVLQRDAHLPGSFLMRPWVFIPAGLIETFVRKFRTEVPNSPFIPVITPLEMTGPWQYCTWDRHGEAPKSAYGIPVEMQSLETLVESPI